MDKREFDRREELEAGRNLEEAEGFALEMAVGIYAAEAFENFNSRKAARTDLKQFVAFAGEKNLETLGDLGALEASALEALCLQFLESRRKSNRDRGLTLRRKAGSLRGFFRFWRTGQGRIIRSVPTLDKKEFKEVRRRSDCAPLTLNEWESLKEALSRSPDRKLYPLACLAVMGGGRKFSECAALRWKHIDFELNLIALSPSKGRDEYRYLPLSEPLKKILKAFKGVENDREDFVFNNLNANNINRALKRAADRSGVEKRVSFGTLRASFIYWAAERGDSPGEVLNATQHANPQMLKYYDVERPSTISQSSILKTEA